MNLLQEWFEGVTDFFAQYNCVVVNFNWDVSGTYFRFSPMEVGHESRGSVTVRLDKQSNLPLGEDTKLELPRSGLTLRLSSISYSDGYTEAEFNF